MPKRKGGKKSKNIIKTNEKIFNILFLNFIFKFYIVQLNHLI